MRINRIKPIFIIWCAFVGHKITKEDEDNLFACDGIISVYTECSRCCTPLTLSRTRNNNFRVKETYWE